MTFFGLAVSLQAQGASQGHRSHERDDEPQSHQGVNAGDPNAEANVGHDALRREPDLYGGHRTSPRNCPARIVPSQMYKSALKGSLPTVIR